jgi:hypothetical protein
MQVGNAINKLKGGKKVTISTEEDILSPITPEILARKFLLGEQKSCPINSPWTAHSK